jgi:N-acetylglucosamine-6-phosphate deacetylase
MMSEGPRAIAAAVVFDGTRLLEHHAVIFKGSDILGLVPCADTPRVPTQILPDRLWLAPGFIDAQCNGGGDVLFNDSTTPEGIAAIVAAHRRFVTTAMLPTLISDTPAKMHEAADAVAAARAAMPEVLGIHFEGPFLSPERAGIHDPALFRIPTEADFALLTGGAANEVRLVTLAPERVPDGFVTALAMAGAKVALGHSMASYEQTRAAIAQGLTGFTHLFNAMRPMASRDPGPIAAALEEPEAFCGLIVDGEHVAAPMLRLALRGACRCFLVTDAMPPVGGRARGYTLAGKAISVRDGRCTAADGVLAGSSLDMASAVRNCVRLLGLELSDALHLATAAPAAFLGIEQRHGYLAAGRRADFIALDPAAIEVRRVWVAGREFAVP